MGSTKNMETEMEAWKQKENTEYGIKYQWYKIQEFHNLHNFVQIIQREFVLVFLAVPLDIFLLLCLDKVCCSVGYCTVRPMKVILSVIFFSQVYGWIIHLKITFLAKCIYMSRVVVAGFRPHYVIVPKLNT